MAIQSTPKMKIILPPRHQEPVDPHQLLSLFHRMPLEMAMTFKHLSTKELRNKIQTFLQARRRLLGTLVTRMQITTPVNQIWCRLFPPFHFTSLKIVRITPEKRMFLVHRVVVPKKIHSKMPGLPYSIQIRGKSQRNWPRLSGKVSVATIANAEWSSSKHVSSLLLMFHVLKKADVNSCRISCTSLVCLFSSIL